MGLLKDLKADITKIRQIMIDVATGRNIIQDCEEIYKNLHYSIETKVYLLSRYEIEIVHYNTFGSLWEFHSYWKSNNLDTYQERREYVASLYNKTERKINKLLIELDNNATIPNVVVDELYLEIENVPDDFYRQLINLINECYSKAIYVAVPIFSRKLLESLIVDIFKKKYGNSDITIFFDTGNRKYHGFNKLLKTFENNLDDFKVDMNLDKTFIKDISRFREKGNVTVHVLELDIKKNQSELENTKEELNHIIKKLIRLEKNIIPL